MSVGLQCRLEVLAPTLSKVPIFVRQRQQNDDDDITPSIQDHAAVPTQEEEEEAWDAVDQESSPENNDDETPVVVKQHKSETQRKEIQKAVQIYLQRSIQLENVAHSLQPIRLRHDDTTSAGAASSDNPSNNNDNNNNNNSNTPPPPPQLQVDMIICGPNDDENSDGDIDEPVATLKMIRMVNQIPLLDGAEAAACGLVQGLVSNNNNNKQIWGSFGLVVVGKSSSSSSSPSSSDHHQEEDGRRTWVPTFEVQDSEQVTPFFKRNQTHALWEAREQEDHHHDDDDDDDNDNDDIEARCRRKRKRSSRRRNSSSGGFVLLPAKVRLGEILVICQIHADPLSLPLPTLSKVRATRSRSFFFMMTGNERGGSVRMPNTVCLFDRYSVAHILYYYYYVDDYFACCYIGPSSFESQTD